MVCHIEWTHKMLLYRLLSTGKEVSLQYFRAGTQCCHISHRCRSFRSSIHTVIHSFVLYSVIALFGYICSRRFKKWIIFSLLFFILMKIWIFCFILVYSFIHRRLLLTLKISRHTLLCRSFIIILFRPQIHKHCLTICRKICPKIILRQKLWCHKIILWHVLSHFTKFVSADLSIVSELWSIHCLFSDSTIVSSRFYSWSQFSLYIWQISFLL